MSSTEEIAELFNRQSLAYISHVKNRIERENKIQLGGKELLSAPNRHICPKIAEMPAQESGQHSLNPGSRRTAPRIEISQQSNRL